jgi:hypothetical protein
VRGHEAPHRAEGTSMSDVIDCYVCNGTCVDDAVLDEDGDDE